MIVVHHLNNSRSQRVLWLLEELGVPYRIKRYERHPKTMLAPESLREAHPLGRAPVIDDGDVTVAESGAIVEYIVERYGGGRLVPAAGTPERFRYTYWLHYAEGSAVPPLLLKLVFSRLPEAPMPFFVRPIARAISNRAIDKFIGPQIARHLHYLETEIGRSEWFAGDAFTAADIQMSFPLEAAVSQGGLDSGQPGLMKFLGSSGNSGESGSDFEEEVFVVAESVGHSLDDFDLVVEAFEQAGVEGPGGVGDDAGEIGFEFPGEGDEGFDGALDGAAEPAFPGRLCRAFGSLFHSPLRSSLTAR